MRERLHGLMQIFVLNPLERKTMVLEVLPSDTMGRVREMVEEKSGVPVRTGLGRTIKTGLGWAYCKFEDDKTLEFYNILKESTIEITDLQKVKSFPQVSFSKGNFPKSA